MVPTPARMGAKVRTIGTNRASTMVLEPWRSKYWRAFSTYSCLKIRESGRRNSVGPTRLPKA